MRTSICLTFAVVFAILLSACGQAGATATPTVTVAPPAPTHTATAAPTRTVPPSPTPTAAPTHTASPTVTPTPTSTATPAPTASPTITLTPPPGKCVAPASPPLPTSLDELYQDMNAFYIHDEFGFGGERGALLHLLNAGADPEALEAALNAIPAPSGTENLHAGLQVSDLDGKYPPDLLVWLTIPQGPENKYIYSMLLGFRCVNGAYQTMLAWGIDALERTSPQDGAHMLAIRDLNLDGQQDLVLYLRAGSYVFFTMLTWDGEHFAALLEPVTDPLVFEPVTYRKFIGTLAVQDLNHDGVAEVVATLSPNDELWDDLWEHCPGGVDVYAWDGEAYRLNCTFTTP